MTIIRWSPIPASPVRNLFGSCNEFDRVFDGFFNRAALRADLAQTFLPAVDIEETPDAFVLRADLPGMSQKDVKVSLMGDILTIRGERKRESVRDDGSMQRVERAGGAFERSFSLGAPVRSDGVKAQVKDGVLEIHVPKAEEARLREVEVQVAS